MADEKLKQTFSRKFWKETSCEAQE